MSHEPRECHEVGDSPMTNSHILVHDFTYHRPRSLAAVFDIMERCGEDARLLAGGTNLLVDMKTGTAVPASVIDITYLPGLRGIQFEESGALIGALTPIRALGVSGSLWAHHTALAEAAAAFGSTQVATMGTLGGNVANGSPASDTVPALLALNAEIVVASPDGEKRVPVADILLGPGRVSMGANAIITQVRLPAPTEGSGSAFLKLARVRADLAKVNVAALLVQRSGRVANARVALGSVGPTVILAQEAARMLVGERFSEERALSAARRAAAEILPIDDVRSTAAYRRKAAVALVHDALVLAWKRATGEMSIVPVRGAAPRSSKDVDMVQRHDDGEGRPIAADARVTIEITVNEQVYELEVATNELLLNVLRERLQLTGAKYGCGIGECGACTVWMNGDPVLACLILAINADGAEIRTVEGLATADGMLDPIQEAFIEENGFQCGFCTPGILMMTARLLEEIGEPTEDEIREYLKGNFCRCTGYASIVRAVQRAAQRDSDGHP